MAKIYTNSQCSTYTKAVENLDIGITIANAFDRYAFVNKAHVKIYGYKQEELIGKTFKIFVPKKLREISIQSWRQTKK